MLVAFVLRIHLPSSFRQFDVLFKSDWYYLVMSVADPESSILKTPEWLEVLENKRKRPHKLAHEIGAGAPCLVCKDRCKGLNLHFWRKLCIECKCRKEDHEVEEEDDYAQFEILFGAKKVKRTTLKFNAQNKSFDWIPPNVPPDLAVDYLKSIPQSKLPISNTEGARYRKQQLEKQLPLHDVDPNACHNLSAKETQEFQKYVENLKNNVIGQGKIMKYQMPEMLQENYIRGTLSNMTVSSTEYENLKPQGVELCGHLTIDKLPGHSAFSQPIKFESHPVQEFNINSNQYSQLINSTAQTHPLRPCAAEIENLNLKNHNQFGKSSNTTIKGPKPYLPTSFVHTDDGRKNCEESINNLQSTLGLRTPSSFIDRKYPLYDKQNNNQSIVHQDDNCNDNSRDVPIVGNLQNFCESSKASSSESLGAKEFVQGSNENKFQPCDATIRKDPFEKFRELNISSKDVPFVPVQETGNVPRQKTHGIISKDKQDNEIEDDSSNFFPTPPATCQQCLGILNPEEIVVQTERGGNLALWHAQCFVCETCKELLVDLMYFFHKGKVFCGRHYAEIMNIPRCYACDELIFVKEYTCAEGETYHVRHFCCFLCDQPLGGKQYIPKDNQPICLDCYQAKYGRKCQTCLLPIAAGEQRVSWKNLDFHVSPQCFRCTNCLKSLLGGRFVVKNDQTFCSKECVQQFVF